MSFSQWVTPGAGVEISAGDGSPIGANMLAATFPELIDFSGDSILLRVYAGSADGGILTTGALGTATQHARYEFSGLQVPGQMIVGLSMGTSDGFAFSGFSGVASPASPGAYIHLVNPGSVSFDLDTLTFKDRGNGQSEAFAEFRIDLATTPVPEPSIGALLFAGLLLLGTVRRARLPMA